MAVNRPLRLDDGCPRQLGCATGTRTKAEQTPCATSEALDLRWCDVDLEIPQLRALQTLQRADGRLQLQPPRSERSRRRLPLPAVAVAALEQHRVQALQEPIARKEILSADDLVFTSTAGTPLEPRNVNRMFAELVTTTGLRQSPAARSLTDLRVPAASPGSVGSLGDGHPAIAVTMNTYGHVMPLMQRDAADRMDELLR